MNKAQVKQMLKTPQNDLKLKQQAYNSVGLNPVSGSAGSLASISYGSSGIVLDITSTIAQGTTSSTRIGNKIRVREVQLRGLLEAGDDTNVVRTLLLKTKQLPGYMASSADLIQAIFGGVGSSTSQYAGAVDTRLFKVLYDSVDFLHFGPNGNSTSSQLAWKSKVFNTTIKVNELITYDLTNGYSFHDGLLLVSLSDSGVVANPGWVSGHVSVWYADE